MGGALSLQAQVGFGPVTVRRDGAGCSQRYKAADDRSLGIGQIVLNGNGDTPREVGRFLQKAAWRLNGLCLAER